MKTWLTTLFTIGTLAWSNLAFGGEIHQAVWDGDAFYASRLLAHVIFQEDLSLARVMRLAGRSIPVLMKVMQLIAPGMTVFFTAVDTASAQTWAQINATSSSGPWRHSAAGSGR